MNFNQILSSLRHYKGLTLVEVSRRTGIHQGNLSNLENGYAPPPKSADKIKLIAEAMDADEDISLKLLDAAYKHHESRLHKKFWGRQNNG